MAVAIGKDGFYTVVQGRKYSTRTHKISRDRKNHCHNVRYKRSMCRDGPLGSGADSDAPQCATPKFRIH